MIQHCYPNKWEISPTLNSAEDENCILVYNEWELFRNINVNVLWLMVSPLFSTTYAFDFSSLYLYSDFDDYFWIFISYIAMSFNIWKAGQYDCASASKESPYNAGDLGSNPGLGRIPGEGTGSPLQYSGLENSRPIGSQSIGHNWATFTYDSFGFGFLLFECKSKWHGNIISISAICTFLYF